MVQVFKDKDHVQEMVSTSRMYSMLFYAPGTLNCISTMDGYFFRVAPDWCEKMQMPEEELKKRPWIDFCLPRDKEWTMKAWACRRDEDYPYKTKGIINTYQGRGPEFYVRFDWLEEDPTKAFVVCRASHATREEYIEQQKTNPFL